MALPQQTPGENSSRRIHWGHAKTKPGTEWHAYLWGDVHWFEAHPSERTKPCLDIMTSGALPCPRCKSGKRREKVGYVPLVRELDGKPCCVLVHEPSYDVVRVLRWRSRVLVCRGPEASDGVAVVKALKQQTWETSLPALREKADLTETLLRLWGISELVGWYRHQEATGALRAPAAGAAPAVAVLPDATTGDVPRTGAALSGDIIRRRMGMKHADGPVTIGELMGHFGAGDGERNGTGHPKPKPK